MSMLGYARTSGILYPGSLMSSSDVTCLCQDQYGYIWIGTTYGLNRFDGYRFYSYRHNSSDTGSLPQNDVCSLFCDSEGHLWVGTGNAISKYDFTRNRFVQIPFPGNIHPRVNSIMESKRGDILIGTAGTGVFVVRKGSDKIMAESRLMQLVKDNFLSRLFEDSDGYLWCKGRFDDFYRIDYQNGQATKAKKFSLSLGPLQQFLTDSSNRLLAVFPKRIMRFEKTDEIWKDAGLSTESIVGEVDMSSAILSKQGCLYIGTTGNGVYTFPKGQSAPQSIDFSDKFFQLSESSTTALMEDRSGNVWTGCFRKGVVLLNHQQNAFRSWTFSPLNGSLSNAQISSMAIDDNGRIWCTVWNKGLYRFNGKGEVSAATSAPRGASLICQGKDGTFWLGAEKGLYRYDPLSGSAQLVWASSEWVNAIAETDRWLFISEFGKGFVRYDKTTGEARQYDTHTNGNKGRLCNNWVNGMIIDSRGDLWIPTARGLSCLNLNNDSFNSYGWEALLDTIASVTVCENAKGNIIIGTLAGIYIYDRQQRKVFPHPYAKALCDTRICSIVCDEDDNLWISTPIGLWQYDASEKELIAYNTGNGQATTEYANALSLHGKDGLIGFGINDGVTLFYPRDIKNSLKEIGKVYVTDINVNGHWASPQSERITIPYEENSFTISFSLLDYKGAENVSYEYRLNGSDWQPNINENNTFTFNRVRPGTYNLEVRAKYGGYYSAENAAVTIVVQSPWYISPLAYCCYALFVAALIVAAIRYYTYMKRMELDDEKMKFLMNATHDIRSPLTLILGPLAKLKDTVNDEKSKSYLDTIDRNAQRLVLLVNQILDERKVDKKQMQLHCRETEMVGFVSSICKLYQYSATQRGITFTLEHDKDYLMAWIDRTNFDKVISNLLSNAFKYTFDGGEVIVSVREHDNRMEIEVTDNGIGIKDEDMNHLFDRFYQGRNDAAIGMQGTGIGLNLSRSIVELHGGKIKAHHRTDGQSGTSFTVAIPLGNKHLKPEQILTDSPARHVLSENNGRHTYSDTNILIVDDDTEIADYIIGELGSRYHFSHCPNGKEAMKELLSRPYDIVISDVMMPEMDGISLLKQIKGNPNTSDLPVILLTSKSEISDKLEGLKKGADAYIAKPFNMEELHIQIDNLIDNVRRLRGKFSGASSQNERIENIKVKSNNDVLMERIMKSVNARLSDPEFNVDQLAADVGLSRAQLHRKMKEMTGIPTGKFLRNLRMEQAARLIKEGKVNVSQVAYSVGFSDQTHFSTVFKNYFGMSPSDYADNQAQ